MVEQPGIVVGAVCGFENVLGLKKILLIYLNALSFSYCKVAFTRISVWEFFPARSREFFSLSCSGIPRKVG